MGHVPSTAPTFWGQYSLDTWSVVSYLDAFGVDASIDNAAVAFGAVRGRRKARFVCDAFLLEGGSRMAPHAPR
eukprot:754925-Pyramimonas_sp.AAC.1